MQVRPPEPPTIFRVQRDGPSPAQQAEDALSQELQAELVATTRRISQLVEQGADQTPTGRAALSTAREELATTAAKLRALETSRRENALGDAARTMAARAIAGGEGTATVAPSHVYPTPHIPPEAVDISMAFFFSVAAAIVLRPLARSFGRILERRAEPRQKMSPEVAAQLQRMEQAIDTVAVEVERISEGQRFTTRLLAERDRVGAQP